MSVAAEEIAPSIVRTQNGLITTLRPMEALTDPTVLEQLHKAIENTLEAGDTQVILDLAGIQVLNSAALEEFLDYQDRLIRAGGWFKLSHATQIVREIFRITGLDKYVSIVGEAMMLDLGMNEYQLGLVFSAFAAGYAIFQFPGGLIGDRFGPRRTIAAIADE